MTIFETALEEINAIRKAEEQEAETRYTAAMTNKDFATAEKNLRAVVPLYTRAKVFKDEKLLAKYRADYNRYDKLRAAVLKKMGLTEQAFSPLHSCPRCNDTGFADGKACACLNQRIIRILEKESGLGERILNSFADSKPEKFAEKDREFLIPLYEKMEQYANKFPAVAKKNLLFFGQSGSGKTFLVNAIAERIGSRGYTVLYTTAFSLNNLFLKYHTTFEGDKTVYMDNLLNCDLLIIDDLGTEPVLKNVTQEYLFSVVNERTAANRAIIVSTNLSLAGLQERYGERTASRLYNKSAANTIQFKTENLRKK